MQKKLFISKVFYMALSGLILNISNMLFNIYISGKAAPAEIGVYHLIMNIYGIFITISISGISLTVTRLIADMPFSQGRKYCKKIAVKCLRICLCTSSICCIALFSLSDFIAESLLGRPEASNEIKILSPTLIFAAVSSVLCGYFTALGRVRAISLGRICGEIVTWIFALLLLKEHTSSAMPIVIVFSLAILTQCICDIVAWHSDSNTLCGEALPINSRQIISLCLPLAVGSYLRTGLSGAENILIPKRLSVSGSINSLSDYGIIKGMTFPILMFPYMLVSAFTLMLVPEIARRKSEKKINSLKYISSLSSEYVLKFAIPVSVIFFLWHDKICTYLFSESDSGKYLELLCFLPAFMLLDAVIDSLLKGLDKQVTSLKINIADSIFRVIGVYFLIPIYGVEAYIFILYASEIINLMFSFITLRKCVGVRFPIINGIIFPLASSAAAAFCALKFFSSESLYSAIAFICIYTALISAVKAIHMRI